jgi:hypothetical protein
MGKGGWGPLLSLPLLLALLLPLFLPAPIPEAYAQKYFLRFDSLALKGRSGEYVIDNYPIGANALQISQSSPISIISFQTDPSPVFVGQNFTYKVKVKNSGDEPIIIVPLSDERFDPPDSVIIVEDDRPRIFVVPIELYPGEVVEVGPHALFSARRVGEVRITVGVSWSYSGDPGSWYIVSGNFSFMVYESQQETYEIYFFIDPPDVGFITFSGTTYTNGQSGKYAAGTYQIEANVPEGYVFDGWLFYGTQYGGQPPPIEFEDPGSPSTKVIIRGGGTIATIFKWIVKLRGTVAQDSMNEYEIYVRIDELLLDTSGRLRLGEEIWIRNPASNWQPGWVKEGDRVEIYGLGFCMGDPLCQRHGIVIKWPMHYVRRIEASGVKFRGVVWTEPNTPYDIEVMIDEVLLDPEGRLSPGSLAHVDIAENTSKCECDWPLHRGDRVEVYARHYWYGYMGEYAVGVWIYSRDNPSDGYIRRLEPTAPVVDVWTNKGGQGIGNLNGGQYSIGESVTLYCSTSTNIDSLRIRLVRPDGTKEETALEVGPSPAGTSGVSRNAEEPVGEWRVICEAQSGGQTSSDEVRFTVVPAPDKTPPTVRVIAPKDGEVLSPGRVYRIKWEASDNVGVSKIHIWLLQGETQVMVIATDYPNTGYFDWRVPDIPGTQFKIRIAAVDAAGNTGYDDSDGMFEIAAVLTVLVVGTCYSDEDFNECRKMLFPELDLTREDNAIRRAVRHLEQELLGKYKIIMRPETPLIVKLPNPSGNYPDSDESIPDYYDPPIEVPPRPSGYRRDTEDALRKAGYEPGEYNAILAIQTDKVLRTFNQTFFRARTAHPHLGRSWGFAALSLYEGRGTLTAWPVYAHELGHALLSLPDYYRCDSSGGRGQLYGWSLMGNHYGWNYHFESIGNSAIDRYVGDGALLDVINKVKTGVLKESLVLMESLVRVPATIDLTPTEHLSLGDKAYMIKVRRLPFLVYNYYIEARSTSVDNYVKREQKIEGGVLLYRQEGGGCWFYVMNSFMNSKYKNKIKDPDLLAELLARYPTLFLSEDKETSRLVDPAAFMVFTLIGDMDASPQSYRPRVRVEFCTPQICGNLKGVVITAQLVQAPSQAPPRNLTYRLDLHAVTADGLHVGFNYVKGEYEIKIPGAYASGPGQMQWIFVPRDSDVRFYVRYVLEGPEAGSWDLPIVFNSTWIEYGPNPQVVNGTEGIEITDSHIQADGPRTLRAGEQMEIKPGETKTTHTQTTTSTTLEATTPITNIRNIDYRLLTLLALASLFMIFIAVIAYSYSPKGGIKCTSCGSRNRRGAIYCRRCGNRLRS